jgi:hypothetical protein
MILADRVPARNRGWKRDIRKEEEAIAKHSNPRETGYAAA